MLADQIEQAGLIDLFVISHIHDDHIGGAIAYARAITRGEAKDRVLRRCYNPPRPDKMKEEVARSTISSAAGIDQGDELVAFLYGCRKLPSADTVSVQAPLELYGLKLFWLSPSPHNLKRLRDKYAIFSVVQEREEDSSVSTASGATGNDYHQFIRDFDLNIWKQDANVENGSSIAFLSDLDGFCILWLADAHPNTIVQLLKNMGYTRIIA